MAKKNNNAWQTGLDDAGETDYSVALARAMAEGASADRVQSLLDARRGKIAGNSALSVYADDATDRGAEAYIASRRAASVPSDFEEYLSRSGYGSYRDALDDTREAERRASQEAYEEELRALNEQTEQAARQAYIAKMQGEKNLAQMLAGYPQSAADSRRPAQESAYQTRLAELTQQRNAAENTLRAARNASDAESDRSYAAQTGEYLAQLEKQYAAQRQAQSEAEREQDDDTRSYYRSLVERAAKSGQSVGAELLRLAGLSEAAYETLRGEAEQQQRSAAARSAAEAEKPRLTLAQALSAIREGIVTQSVRTAFDYYMGEGMFEKIYG